MKNPTQAQRRLVLVGNGMAGMRTIEEILARAPDAFTITVFGAEPHGNYNRIMLSPLLAGEKSFSDIMINDRDWYEARGIELIAGEEAVAIDRDARIVRGARGTERTYDILLLATGSNPVVLPLSGATLPGVITFRDHADVQTMQAAASKGGRAIDIGGGLLGLEAAHGLRRNGMDVTVLHLMPTLMERQLDAAAAGLLRAALEDRGIDIVTGANTQEILGEDCVQGVRLADGRIIEASLVVMTLGIRPNTALAKSAGLTVKRGIVVDTGLATEDPAIFAIGECIELNGECFGLVAPIWEQAKICAGRITGQDNGEYRSSASGTRLKVTGIDMFSAGNFLGDEITEDVIFRDAARGIYKRIVLRGNRVEGVVLYGDAQDGPWYLDLLTSGTDVASIRDGLIFGPAFAGDHSMAQAE